LPAQVSQLVQTIAAPLSSDEGALATRLAMPPQVVALTKACAKKPLQSITFVYERDEAGTCQRRCVPVLCVTFYEREVYDAVRFLHDHLRRLGYLAFIMAERLLDLIERLCTNVEGFTHPGKEGSTLVLAKRLITHPEEFPLTLQGERRCLVGIFGGEDPYEILRMQYTHIYGESTDSIIARLHTWAQSCQFRILGAHYKSVTSYFETLPSDLAHFAHEIATFSAATLEPFYDAERKDDLEEATWEARLEARLALDFYCSKMLTLSY
jgi:hypothetical protein